MEWLALIAVVVLVVAGFVVFFKVCGKLGEITGAIIFGPRMLKMQQEAIAHNQLMANLELQYQLLEAQLEQQQKETV